MSSAADKSEFSAEMTTLARGYWRRVLALRGALGVIWFVLCVSMFFVLPSLPAIVVIALLIVLLAVPLYKSGGDIELTTGRDADTVADDFAGSVPPILALQAVLADEIRRTETGFEYDLSSALGLWSTTMRIEIDRATDDPDPTKTGFTLDVSVGDQSWGTYAVTAREREGKTDVTIEAASNRRFGIRRLPDWVVARRYRDRLFDAQGYTLVAERSALSLR